MSRAYTTDEVRAHFLSYLSLMADYWDGPLPEPRSQRQRLHGLVHSVLSALDGCTDLPAFIVAPDPHTEDRTWAEAEGSDYYQDLDERGAQDIAGGLAEAWASLYKAGAELVV